MPTAAGLTLMRCWTLIAMLSGVRIGAQSGADACWMGGCQAAGVGWHDAANEGEHRSTQ